MTNEVVYVVLAHDPGPQTTRLVHAILRSSPAGRVLVALDGRGGAELSTSDDPRIEVLVHGYASDWGSWELVEATLEACVTRATDMTQTWSSSSREATIR